MQPYQFDYYTPSSVEDAVSLLHKFDGDAQVISGGQSLVAAMNLRLARPAVLVDLRRIPGLDRIVVRENYLAIGARVTHAQIIESDLVRGRIPMLCEAGSHIAHSAIRAWGTMAGSIALADPAAEWPAVLMALDGIVVAVGPSGARRIPASEFFVSLYTTALKRDEIISEVWFPLPAANETHGFCEFARQSGAFALAVAAASVRRDEAGLLKKATVAIGGCGPKPLKFELTQLLGQRPLQKDVEESLAAVRLNPSSDIHATAQSRESMARTVMLRAICRACGIPTRGE
jgi:carbon-monoxide dehydrogenase medium subunit